MQEKAKDMLLDLKNVLTNLQSECLHQVNERKKILNDKKLFTDMISEAEQMIVLKDFRDGYKQKVEKGTTELKDLKKKWSD